MAIYTRTGDQGQTGLRGEGKRVSKSTLQVSVLGTLDELNSHLGLGSAILKSYQRSWNGLQENKNASEQLTELISTVESIQSELFQAGALVAQVLRPLQDGDESSATVQLMDQRFKSKIESLEAAADRYETLLPELKNFILPGGSVAGAQILVARTVCRRTERELVRWMEYLGGDKRRGYRKSEEVSIAFPGMLAYINRLSDWLFVAARYINYLMDEPEQIWSVKSD